MTGGAVRRHPGRCSGPASDAQVEGGAGGWGVTIGFDVGGALVVVRGAVVDVPAPARVVEVLAVAFLVVVAPRAVVVGPLALGTVEVTGRPAVTANCPLARTPVVAVTRTR